MARGWGGHLPSHVQYALDTSVAFQVSREPMSKAMHLVVPAVRPAGSSTAASGTARIARDAASSSGPSDFQAAHFQAASREASWEL